MEAETRVLLFEENRERGGVMAWLPGGVPVFPDRRNPLPLRAGEAWECRVEMKGNVAFAEALRPVAGKEGPPVRPDDPQWITGMLDSPAGAKLKEGLDRSVQAALEERLREPLAKLAERVASAERQVEELQQSMRRASEGAAHAPGPRPPAPADDPSPTRKAPWVSKGEFENSLRALRERLESLARESAAPPLMEEARLAAVDRRLKDLEGRASGTDSSVQQLRRDVDEAKRRRRPAPAAASAMPAEALEDLAQSLLHAAPGLDGSEEAVLASTLAQGQAMQRAAAFVERIRSAGLPLGPPAAFVGVGAFGACAASGCPRPPEGFVPALDLTDPEAPGVLPALACPEHGERPPLIVVLRRAPNRKQAPAALETLAAVGMALGLPRPRSLAPPAVQVHGSAAARQAWNLEARKWVTTA